MEVRRVTFYFTATGNSLYVAKQLDKAPISIPQAIHDKEKHYIADKIGVVCPVFGHEVPVLVKEFLQKSIFDTPYFYLILTYGNRHGGAAQLTEKMLEEMGIHPAYINVLLMVDNYLPKFDMDKQKRMDKKVEEQIKILQDDILRKRHFIAPVTDADRAAHREYLRKAASIPEAVWSNFYYITNQCIGCGICTRVCPKKCFTIKEQKSIWHREGCISCMACIHGCPMMAIQMNVPEKNPKARYRNENISICEIVDANNQLEN